MWTKSENGFWGLLQGSLENTFCPFETWLFQHPNKGNPPFTRQCSGVSIVRIPVLGSLKPAKSSETAAGLVAGVCGVEGPKYGKRVWCQDPLCRSVQAESLRILLPAGVSEWIGSNLDSQGAAFPRHFTLNTVTVAAKNKLQLAIQVGSYSGSVPNLP